MKFNINSIKDFANEKASSIKEKVDSIELDEIKQKGSVLKDKTSEITIDDIKNKGTAIELKK